MFCEFKNIQFGIPRGWDRLRETRDLGVFGQNVICHLITGRGMEHGVDWVEMSSFLRIASRF